MLKSTIVLLAFLMLDDKLDLSNLQIGQEGKLTVSNEDQYYSIIDV
jgi:hypothetical protein